MTKNNNYKELLQSAWMFKNIPKTDITLLSQNISIRKFLPGHTILQEQDTNQAMYIVLKGKVKATNLKENGTETILAIHGDGESFGELSLIDGNTAPAVIVTLEESILAIITKQYFHSILTSHKQIMWNVMNMLCSKLRIAWSNNAILNNNQGASEKVMCTLRQLAKEHGFENDYSILIDVKLTHQNLADITGLTRAYLTRTITSLRNAGVIAIMKTDNGKRFCIIK